MEIPEAVLDQIRKAAQKVFSAMVESIRMELYLEAVRSDYDSPAEAVSDAAQKFRRAEYDHTVAVAKERELHKQIMKQHGPEVYATVLQLVGQGSVQNGGN